MSRPVLEINFGDVPGMSCGETHSMLWRLALYGLDAKAGPPLKHNARPQFPELCEVITSAIQSGDVASRDAMFIILSARPILLDELPMHIIVGGLKDKNYLVSYIQLPPSFVVCILKYRPPDQGKCFDSMDGVP